MHKYRKYKCRQSALNSKLSSSIVLLLCHIANRRIVGRQNNDTTRVINYEEQHKRDYHNPEYVYSLELYKLKKL